MTDRHAAYPTGLKDAPTRHRALRQRMEAPGIVVAPGAYDCITARLVEVAGFDACYITGSGVSMSALGAPVRPRRPGPAGFAQEHAQHRRHGQPDARSWPALVAVRERALAGAGEEIYLAVDDG